MQKKQMPTFLFDKVVFGPVMSRRLGVSLGINLLPVNKKICSFDCIYCECGLNGELGDKKGQLPTRQEVKEALNIKLQEMLKDGLVPDVITFAGNGEPTMHPDFEGIIDDTISIRDKQCVKARIAVLSNASRIDRKEVFEALLKVDDNIQKLDSGLLDTILLLDKPNYPYNLKATINNLAAFKGKVIIQTMFVTGHVDDKLIDNTSEPDIESWLKALAVIQPSKVMIYTIERDTPFNTLKKVSLQQLKDIAAKAEAKGFTVSVSG
ncbi:MAG: hypothetical protein JEZ14_10240 [Marinilabiliaceae bacterium]|nr:hypothetical protein [Marinilabiliaceae bacterium]